MRMHIPKWEEDVVKLSELVYKYTSDPWYLTTEQSKKNYDDVLRQYIAFLLATGHDNDVKSFTPDTVEGFAQYMFSHGLAASTVCTRLSILSGLAKYATQTDRAGGRQAVGRLPQEPEPGASRPCRASTVRRAPAGQSTRVDLGPG